ncbi:MAG: membrane integrity-associated transporter subunit PqiC [bacterium]|nr:membrane integrity-associated transporter subunit PqiC [bacterium]
MTAIIRRMGMCALLAACATGCASASARFYTLSATATADGSPAVPWAVTVGPVTVPAAVDRPQFVVEVSPNRLQLDEFNRWAAPLDDNIARVVAADLAVLLATDRVVPGPIPSFAATYRVTIDVQQFVSVPGGSALVDAVWSVQPVSGGTPRVGRTVAREDVTGPGFDALAAAHSRALARVSADVAAALRAQAPR